MDRAARKDLVLLRRAGRKVLGFYLKFAQALEESYREQTHQDFPETRKLEDFFRLKDSACPANLKTSSKPSDTTA